MLVGVLDAGLVGDMDCEAGIILLTLATPQKYHHSNSYHHVGCLSVVHLPEKAAVSLVIRRHQFVGRFPSRFQAAERIYLKIP